MKPEICECGHAQGDHKSNRAPIAGVLMFGTCLRCQCPKFAPVDQLAVAQEENRRLRELLATLGWGPARLREHLAADADPGRKVPPTR